MRNMGIALAGLIGAAWAPLVWAETPNAPSEETKPQVTASADAPSAESEGQAQDQSHEQSAAPKKPTFTPDEQDMSSAKTKSE